MRYLHEISSDLLALAAVMTDLEGEIPEGEIGEALENWFRGLNEERDAKIKGFCALITHLEAEADYAEAESRRIAAIENANRNAVDRLKKRLKAFFELHNIKKLELGIFKPRIQANGGALPLIVPEDWKAEPKSAPDIYQKVNIVLDTEYIRRGLEMGADVEGCALGERGTHLRIR